MNVTELGRRLSEMYSEAPRGEAVAMIHLFAIRYAEAIKESSVSCKTIAQCAGIPESYGTEISKGIKLSKYVRPK